MLHQSTIKALTAVAQLLNAPLQVFQQVDIYLHSITKFDMKAKIFITEEFHCIRYILCSYLEDGACTDHPKSAIFNSPLEPSSRFSGLMSR